MKYLYNWFFPNSLVPHILTPAQVLLRFYLSVLFELIYIMNLCIDIVYNHNFVCKGYNNLFRPRCTCIRTGKSSAARQPAAQLAITPLSKLTAAAAKNALKIHHFKGPRKFRLRAAARRWNSYLARLVYRCQLSYCVQGKFQMLVLPQVGHAIQEDSPDKVSV